MHQAGFTNILPYNGQYSSSKSLKNMGITTAIYQLPNVLFVDLAYVLGKQIEGMAKEEQSMKDKTLEAYCKVCKLNDGKLEMDHNIARELLLWNFNKFGDSYR